MSDVLRGRYRRPCNSALAASTKAGRQFKVAVMAFRVLHGLAPPYLNQLVRVSDLPGRRKLCSSSSQQLLVPPFRLTTVGRRSFPVAASLLWNSLPSDIQSSPSLPVFRQRLKHFFFDNHFLILYCDSTTPLWTS